MNNYKQEISTLNRQDLLWLIKYQSSSIYNCFIGFHFDESEQKRCKWKWMQSETISLADVGYPQLRRELYIIKKAYSQVVHELECLKQGLVLEKKQVSSSKEPTSINGKLFYQQYQTKYSLFIICADTGEVKFSID